MPATPPVDSLGRQFKSLRLSVTNACNLRCLYCQGEEGAVASTSITDSSLPTQPATMRPRPHSFHPASYYQRLVAAIHYNNPLSTIRLTGGEPLLYPHLTELVVELRRTGDFRLHLTTNGLYLARHAAALRAAGLDSVNLSLDAADRATFHRVTGRDRFDDAIAGLKAALAAGLQVKLNATIMRGINHEQILPLVELAFGHSVELRFLELMRMGPLGGEAEHAARLFPQSEIIKVIAQSHHLISLGRKEGATAERWASVRGDRIGIIANHSTPFCGDCDRLRVDSEGNLYGCLSQPESQSLAALIAEYPTIPTDDSLLRQRIFSQLRTALTQKRVDRFTGSLLNMKNVGG